MAFHEVKKEINYFLFVPTFNRQQPEAQDFFYPKL